MVISREKGIWINFPDKIEERRIYRTTILTETIISVQLHKKNKDDELEQFSQQALRRINPPETNLILSTIITIREYILYISCNAQ